MLTPQEVNDFFVTLRQIADDGRGLIFISHKLHEVMALSDRITVLRDGKVTGTTTPSQTSRQQLAQMMVGRSVKLAPDKPPVAAGVPRLELQEVSVMGDREALAVHAVDLSVAGGEILGIAGVSGNGQRELCEAVAGLRPVTAGSVLFDGQDTTGASPRRCRMAGLAYVSRGTHASWCCG